MKKNRLTRGENFLPDVDIDKLRTLRRKETNAKARDRLLVYIYRKGGKSIREIGRVFGQAYSTIRDWLVRADQAWLERLYDIPKPGLPRRLTPKQLADLKVDLLAGPQRHGFESEMWTGKMIVEYVRRKYSRVRSTYHAATNAQWGFRTSSQDQSIQSQPQTRKKRHLKKSQTDSNILRPQGL